MRYAKECSNESMRVVNQHSHYGEDGRVVDELVLVLLDADVVRAVVDVHVAVLCAQPHRCLERKGGLIC